MRVRWILSFHSVRILAGRIQRRGTGYYAVYERTWASSLFGVGKADCC